jgi:hypothetical protein
MRRLDGIRSDGNLFRILLETPLLSWNLEPQSEPGFSAISDLLPNVGELGVAYYLSAHLST